MLSNTVPTIPSDVTVAFSWNGLPQYAARLLRAAVRDLNRPCPVIGSRPAVPVEGMEDALGQPILWIDPEQATSWSALGLGVPSVFFQSGWNSPAFNALGDEVRHAGGRVIGMSDANFRGDFRQLVLGAVWFRLRYRSRFDAMIVPGTSGNRLMRYFGLARDRIFQGMYGADPALFQPGPALAERAPRFLFVGQFIPRKGVMELCTAFSRFRRKHPEWELEVIGSGPLKDNLPRTDGIQIRDFVQPSQLGAHFDAARFFVLPSHVEAWGLVVHEAALAGCGLLLSTAIGSAEDFADSATLRFKPGSVDAIERTLENAAALPKADLDRLQQISLAKAQDFGPERFARTAIAAIARVMS